jgi:two-component system response regulator RpfG
MPGMDGVAFTRAMRAIPDCADVPLVVVTVVEDRNIRYEALDAGATDFLNRPIDQHECQARCRNLLTLRCQQKIISNRAHWLEQQVQVATEAIQARERETLLRLAKAGEYRDEGTGNHVLRIGRYSRLIAEALSLGAQQCHDIELAASMHDIGKVGIPDGILLKSGRLTEDEFRVVQQHARIGYEILKDSPSYYLQLGATIALAHHERYDGSGYPGGIAGADIPLAARIVAVVDVFDALTSSRPYKRPWSVSAAVQYIRDRSGSHFDPDCVTAFLANLDAIRTVRQQLHDAQRTDRMGPNGQYRADSDCAGVRQKS